MNILHIYVQEEEWKFVCQDAIDGKVNETEREIILRELSLEIEVCKGMCEAYSDRTHTSRGVIVIEFTIKSTKKLLVKPPVTVDLSSCSAAFHDVSLHCDEAHRIEIVTRSDDNFFPCFRTRNDADADFLVYFTVSHGMLHLACSIVITKKTSGSTDLAHVACL